MRAHRKGPFSPAGVTAVAAMMMVMALSPRALRGQDEPVSKETAQRGSQDLGQQVAELHAVVEQLQARISELEKEVRSGATAVSSRTDPSVAAPPSASAAAGSTPQGANVTHPVNRGGLNLPEGVNVNLALDGYYEYNFNRPVGRVNLLRAYDVSSNSFSLNQAALVIERPATPDRGQPLGIRLDLQYGQATETLQGSAANELRPQVYRPVFQAYGTYVAPVGSGLTIDFGKWASALGIENNYTKDQINYSRAYLFDFLPFYHMGVRASYNLTPRINLAYWLVNGAQQTEDFNGFKSQAFILTLKPRKNLIWNVNYYFGQEQRDVVAVLNPLAPNGPTQPGLPVAPIRPTPDGRLHILESYATWNATAKLTLAGEADYVINREFSGSPPKRVSGGAAYARYQFTPKFALAGRGEYLSDRGGLFSGATQALKEATLTSEYKLGDGFLVREEWRRDFSNRPFFLTEQPGLLKKEQNTATVGLIWWFGPKLGAW